ncbi:MAG: hypothetical protein ABSF26_28385 [Thermoguttaceae bacterium]
MRKGPSSSDNLFNRGRFLRRRNRGGCCGQPGRHLRIELLESRALLTHLLVWFPNGSTVWNDGINLNWIDTTNGNVPTLWIQQSDAEIPASASGQTIQISSSSTVQVNSMTFDSGQGGSATYAVQGGTISLWASQTAISVGSSATATIASAIAGPGSGQKTDAGTLLVSGSLNVGTSSITVSAGQLNVQSGGSITAHGLTISDGATLVGSGTISIDGGGLHYDSSAASTFAGVITGAGGVVLDSGTTGSLTLSGTGNTYTGDTTVDGGSLIVSGRVGTGSTPTGDVVADNAATLEVDGSLTAQSVTIQDSAVLAGGRRPAERQHLQTAA